MCVENTFEKGAVGSLHHHPHTQITYVVSGEFEFDIEGEKKIVKAGDTMLKLNGVEHGCVCLEAVSYTHLDVYKRQGQWKESFLVWKARISGPF